MHEKLISAHLFKVFGFGASVCFEQSWENSNFEDFNEVPLNKIHSGVKEVLESGVLSESATKEVELYYYALDKFIKSQP